MVIGVWKLNFIILIVARVLIGSASYGIAIGATIGIQDWFPKRFSTPLTILLCFGRIVMSI